MTQSSITPTVSIIIPTYKPTHFLRECIESIARQSFKDFEIIIVLNGCAEPYLSQLNDLRECNDSVNIKIFQTDTPGVSNARNLGLDKAKGNFVAFVDDDDLITTHYLQGMLDKFDGTTSVVFSNVEVIDKLSALAEVDNDFNNAYYHLKCKQKISLFSLRKLLNAPWGKLYRRSVIGISRFNPRFHIGEDALFNFCVSKNINKVAFSDDDSKYLYRFRPESVSKTSHTKSFWINLVVGLNSEYVKTYLKSPSQYNLMYLISRIIGNWKFVMAKIIHRKNS